MLAGYGLVLAGYGSVLAGYGLVLAGYGSVLAGYGSVLAGYGSVLADSSFSSTSGHTLPHPRQIAEQTKNVAGHQSKCTVVLGLVLKRD